MHTARGLTVRLLNVQMGIEIEIGLKEIFTFIWGILKCIPVLIYDKKHPEMSDAPVKGYDIPDQHFQL